MDQLSLEWSTVLIRLWVESNSTRSQRYQPNLVILHNVTKCFSSFSWRLWRWTVLWRCLSRHFLAFTSSFLSIREKCDADSVQLGDDTDFGVTGFTSSSNIPAFSCFSTFVTMQSSVSPSSTLRSLNSAIDAFRAFAYGRFLHTLSAATPE